MGACMSSTEPTGVVQVTEEDKARNKAVEKELKEAKARMARQIKVLLLGSGDSGKSTILKQMRMLHNVPFTPSEVENYRRLVFNNLTHGLQGIIEAMQDMELKVEPANQRHVELIQGAVDLKEQEAFPDSYREALGALWNDNGVQQTWARANEAALPENLPYWLSSLDRVFDPKYTPTEQDIVQCRARTIGMTETLFGLRDKEMFVIDVGGQRSERRKWIHCFQDVTTILFLVSLSGYDACLAEDRDANQMIDAMTIFESICQSKWFEKTSIILFLNKSDLFEKKIEHSNISAFFPDFSGPEKNAAAGREYFSSRFNKLGQRPGLPPREIYTHITTATDLNMLRAVMQAVEDIIMRGNLIDAGLI